MELNEKNLDWDDIIENDSPEFLILPEGDYDFVVTDFQRARHPGSDKLPSCNKAELKLRIDTPDGSATVQHNLFLHSKCEGFLCEFFSAIGQRQRGEQLKMNWSKVIGSTGRCKIGIRTWTGKDGEQHQSNEVKKLYAREAKIDTPGPSFTPGAF